MTKYGETFTKKEAEALWQASPEDHFHYWEAQRLNGLMKAAKEELAANVQMIENAKLRRFAQRHLIDIES